MVTKYILSLFVLGLAGGALAGSCETPQVEAESFTSLDATIVTQIAYITEFTLKCSNPDSLPKNYALYAEVDGKLLTAARIGENEGNYKYQISWTEDPAVARSGVRELSVLDEDGWATLRRARRGDPRAAATPLLAIQLHHPGSYNGPWVNTEVLATALAALVAFAALRNKSAILA